MEALKMEDRVDSWNDERLDELSRRMDEGFKEMREGFAQSRQEMKEGFEQVDKRFEQVDKRFERLYLTMISASFGLVISAYVALVFG
ncbi:MAG TPA: hypothetical protein VD761_08430 [Solirubrobacterales bacterium]|nr:hypothetical protein [Solirubrobacterales bacterium]